MQHESNRRSLPPGVFTRIGSKAVAYFNDHLAQITKIGFMLGHLSPCAPPLEFVAEYRSLEEMSRQKDEPHVVGVNAVAGPQPQDARTEIEAALAALQTPGYFEQAVRELDA